MATSFPSSLDSFVNPSGSDALDSVSVPHAAQHANLNDAMLAVQTKLGVGAGTIGTWTAYTPTLTNWTASLATFQYARVNNVVFVRFYTQVATMGTQPIFSLPVAIVGFPEWQSFGILDVGSAWYQGNFLFHSSTSASMWYLNTSSAAGVYATITASAPFTWASGDVISGGLWYMV